MEGFSDFIVVNNELTNETIKTKFAHTTAINCHVIQAIKLK
jgi:hypothetical protein